MQASNHGIASIAQESCKPQLENGGRLSYTYLHPTLEAGEVRKKSWQLINLFPVKLMI
jgi:hypothetical protein